ncbi:Oidioi.mRNA.OKI2018_I69.PAR.g11110.t1.cds [Oikopleura dioica]|uniref:Oidioi.mRNA.OKI2018_I69.PAR.g11110.t1.cds n=1 Tax=Oikopleura dioica TaxID=34765 RepID=A0ABN7S0V7_OIKDI|nr:Oidioi.mRNA.OKI2018_I69.PAR.g11110.t1.cds [Oikopleura dioica]
MQFKTLLGLMFVAKTNQFGIFSDEDDVKIFTPETPSAQNAPELQQEKMLRVLKLRRLKKEMLDDSSPAFCCPEEQNSTKMTTVNKKHPVHDIFA